MKRYKIVILPGDGIGPEVMAQAMRTLEAIENAGLCGFDLETIPCAGSYYIDHGQEWADGSYETCKAADGIMLGAIGHIGPDGMPVRRADGELAGYEQVIGIRMKLDLYANMRPIKLFEGVRHSISGVFKPVWAPENVNLVVFRENTEGAYSPGGFSVERGESVEVVISPTIITRVGAARVVHRAFKEAQRRPPAREDGVRRVTCVDKSNVVRAHRFFRDIFREVAQNYPDIESDFAYVDAYCHNLVRAPEHYDVVVAPNLPGDIITDLGSVLQGGMGMAASGNIGDEHAMFEPVHGSAPDIVGQEKANPVACVLSTSMMLNWLGGRHGDEATARAGNLLDLALADALRDGKGLTPDLGGSARTSESGDAIVAALKKRLASA